VIGSVTQSKNIWNFHCLKKLCLWTKISNKTSHLIFLHSPLMNLIVSLLCMKKIATNIETQNWWKPRRGWLLVADVFSGKHHFFASLYLLSLSLSLSLFRSLSLCCFFASLTLSLSLCLFSHCLCVFGFWKKKNFNSHTCSSFLSLEKS